MEIEFANLQYLELVIRTADLLVVINLKRFQELQDDRQALFQADAVVTSEVFRIGLGILRAAQVPSCLCEQLTAALRWCQGKKQRSHCGAVCSAALSMLPKVLLPPLLVASLEPSDLSAFQFTSAGVVVTLKLVARPARTEVATHVVVAEVLALRPFVFLSSIVRVTFIKI